MPLQSTSSCGSRVRITRLRSRHDPCSRRPGARRRSGTECGGSTKTPTRTRRRSGSRATTRSPSSSGSRRGEPVARDDAVVVESHQLDHVTYIVFIVDPASRHRVLPREDRVIDDAALLAEGDADLLAEAEVRRVIAVQMADLMAVDAEAPLAALAIAGFDAGPCRDLVGDDLAGCPLVAHGASS